MLSPEPEVNGNEIVVEDPPDRRKKKRFPIQRELRYTLVEADDDVVQAGAGMTLNVSSGGVAFHAQHELQEGQPVQLSISWPALLDERCLMRLIVLGRIVRTEGNVTVCSVDKYEFRTQARVLRPVIPLHREPNLVRWAIEPRREILKAGLPA